MLLNKSQAVKLLGSVPTLLNKINKIKGDDVFVEVYSRETYKTNSQNRLFHALLSCFWESGCSSFDNYDDLRLYYKRIAGLVKKQGNLLVETSWADATKSQAKTTIDMLLRDMDYSAVLGSSVGKKYERILKGINQWIEDFM